MSVPSYPFHFLSLKLPNKGMDFPFPLLKLPNKRREKYSKLFFLFLSISFPPPKRSLRKEPLIQNLDFDAHKRIVVVKDFTQKLKAENVCRLQRTKWYNWERNKMNLRVNYINHREHLIYRLHMCLW